MLKMFPLPSFLERFARRRIVNVALFGNGISLAEWSQLGATYWHHHLGFAVQLVESPAEADVLAVHGPMTQASWSFFERWMSARVDQTVVIAVGAEVHTLDGHIISPLGEKSSYTVDAILPGHPPTPAALKSALAQLLQKDAHV